MKQNTLKSVALVIAAGTLIKLLGFMREVTLAATYGAGSVSDAFIISFSLPGIALSAIGSAAACAFIPAYYKAGCCSQSLLNSLLSCLALIGIAFSAFFSLFPQLLVYIFASRLEPGTFALAVSFTRIIAWSATPVLLAELLCSYLRLQNVFFWAAATGAALNIFSVPCIALSRGGPMIMPFGVLSGSFAHLALLALLCRKHGYVYAPAIDFKSNQLHHLFICLIPILLTGSISEINRLIDRNFASALPVGGVSSLNYASRLISLLNAAMGSAVVAVLFPKMSEMASRGDIAALKRSVSDSLAHLTPVLLPASMGTALLAAPIVHILFERGSFTAEDTQVTAQCLQMYCAGLLFANINPLLSRAFQAYGDMRTPAICSLVAVGINLLLNFLLVDAMQHRGLALSTSLASAAATFLLATRFRAAHGQLVEQLERREMLKSAVSTTVMGAAVWIGKELLPTHASGTIVYAAATACLVLAAAVLYILLMLLMRSVALRKVLGETFFKIAPKWADNAG